ncbi:hypothetical protein ACQEVF_34125 [Nonomuraea polychroma]|uniref:hypothetical protein n=1 Tax=Nonomuraea polychroma TaxID=46176 RepID=UPI003D902B61
MISYIPRVVYRPLPDGQDWTVLKENGKSLIAIKQALDEPGRQRAEKAARASIRRRRGPVAGAAAFIAGAGVWAGEKARDAVRTPAGSATVASILATGAVYAITETARHEHPPIAEPPAVVTVLETPPVPTAGTFSPSIRETRPPETRPTPTRGATAPARPTRTSPPPQARQPPPTAPNPETDQPTATAVPTTTAEPEDEPSAPAPPPATSAPPPPPAATAASCGGTALDVRLDPLLGLDACLLG